MHKYKYEKVQNDKDLPIRIISFSFEKKDGEVKKPQNLTYDAHWHENLEVLVPIKGNLDVLDNEKILKVHEGEVYIINSRNVHKVRWDMESDVYQGYCLQIDYDFIKKQVPNINELTFNQPDQVISDAIRRSLLEGIISAKENNPYISLYINGMIYVLLYVLLHELSSNKNESSNKKIQYKQRTLDFLSYIEAHYKEDFPLEKIASHFNMSVGHFSKIFKQQLGITPKEYISNYRLTQATVDLVETDHAIIDIAFEHGFTNINSFYTIFKKEYGISPAQYRKKMKKSQ